MATERQRYRCWQTNARVLRVAVEYAYVGIVAIEICARLKKDRRLRVACATAHFPECTQSTFGTEKTSAKADTPEDLWASHLPIREDPAEFNLIDDESYFVLSACDKKAGLDGFTYFGDDNVDNWSWNSQTSPR